MDDADVDLVDAGDGRRLDRLGDRLVDRPAPTATEPPRFPGAWRAADLRFDAGRGWTNVAGATPPRNWTTRLGGLVMELRPTSSGGVGLYPEQALNLGWLEARIAERAGDRGAERPGDGAAERPAARPVVLNLFAHTGLATLAAARAGASVVHVDATRSSVGWARRNAGLNGLAAAPVRWIVDDALGFTAREGRRARRYDGVVLDPPSFGRAGGERWRLLDDLPALLDACALVAADGAFVLLTAHTAGVEPGDLAAEAGAAFGRRAIRSRIPQPEPEVVPMDLEARSGAHLRLGWAIRLAGRPPRGEDDVDG